MFIIHHTVTFACVYHVDISCKMFICVRVFFFFFHFQIDSLILSRNNWKCHRYNNKIVLSTTLRYAISHLNTYFKSNNKLHNIIVIFLIMTNWGENIVIINIIYFLSCFFLLLFVNDEVPTVFAN